MIIKLMKPYLKNNTVLFHFIPRNSRTHKTKIYNFRKQIYCLGSGVAKEVDCKVTGVYFFRG